MSNYALHYALILTKKSLLHVFHQQHFLFKNVNTKKKEGRHILKVQILIEFYRPLYISYLLINNTTHHYSLKFYNHT